MPIRAHQHLRCGRTARRYRFAMCARRSLAAEMGELLPTKELMDRRTSDRLVPKPAPYQRMPAIAIAGAEPGEIGTKEVVDRLERNQLVLEEALERQHILGIIELDGALPP